MSMPIQAIKFHEEIRSCVANFLKHTEHDKTVSGLEAVAAIGSAGVSLIEQCAHAFETIGMQDAGAQFVQHTQSCLQEFLKIYTAKVGDKTLPVDQTLH